jgi:hypothetical protein
MCNYIDISIICYFIAFSHDLIFEHKYEGSQILVKTLLVRSETIFVARMLYFQMYKLSFYCEYIVIIATSLVRMFLVYCCFVVLSENQRIECLNRSVHCTSETIEVVIV